VSRLGQRAAAPAASVNSIASKKERAHYANVLEALSNDGSDQERRDLKGKIAANDGRVDEVDYFLCWRSSSAPKKLAARSEFRWCA
jgi:hypothetical protein